MKHEGRWLLAICALALAVRLLYVLSLKPEIYWYDGEQYSHLAQEMLQHHGYSRIEGKPSAFWPPGYPFLLAGIYALFGVGVTGVRIVQSLLGVITVALTWRIARRVLTPPAALAAAAVAALYPFFIYSTGAVFPIVLQSTLLAGGVALALIAIERNSGLAALAAGLVGGWGCLTVGSALPGALLIAPWLAAAREWSGRRRRGLAIAALYLLGLIGPLGGWAIRNQIAFGHPVLISTNFGYNLWLGNYPGVRASTGNRDVPGMEREASQIWQSPGTEVSRDQRFLKLAFRYIASDVSGFLKLTGAKAVEFWAIYSEPMTQARPRFGREWLASLLSYGLLLPFALFWVVATARRSRLALLVLGLFVINTLIHAVILSKLRYRLPLDTFVIVFGVGGIAALLRRLRTRRASSPAR